MDGAVTKRLLMWRGRRRPARAVDVVGRHYSIPNSEEQHVHDCSWQRVSKMHVTYACVSNESLGATSVRPGIKQETLSPKNKNHVISVNDI